MDNSLNSAGLLVCFGFLVSEYQILYNDCMSEHLASNSISYVAKLSIIFLVGAALSLAGISFHDFLLGKYMYVSQKRVEDSDKVNPQEFSQITKKESKKLVNIQGYFWSASLAFFMLGLLLSYVAIFSINVSSVENTVKAVSRQCPQKITP